jgi:DNA-directed RNA polymerase subunit M/transcription elongation factor TFIIS
MTEKRFKQVCKCEKCGNEAEMMITCSLELEENVAPESMESKASKRREQGKTMGHAVCSHCGGEADIWLDL